MHFVEFGVNGEPFGPALQLQDDRAGKRSRADPERIDAVIVQGFAAFENLRWNAAVDPANRYTGSIDCSSRLIGPWLDRRGAREQKGHGCRDHRLSQPMYTPRAVALRVRSLGQVAAPSVGRIVSCSVAIGAHDLVPSSMAAELLTARLESALRWAAVSHQGQSRRASGVPYFAHLAAVALILERAGYDEAVVIAGVLHDIIEDTPATLADVETRFGPLVAEIVGYCSEVKTDATGAKRAWIDRKRDHLVAMRQAPSNAKAVILADKLHNLISIEADLCNGFDVWSAFHAPRDQVLWYYAAAIDACTLDDPWIDRLVVECREALRNVTPRD
jgi:guanosine-3',5'-bis(diphosphate) 3'-pyrophosphohydrolase